MPPKSLFVQLLALALIGTLPLLLLNFNAQLSAETLLAALGTVISVAAACLLADVLLTYRKYQSWASVWLCGDCRSDFRENGQLIPIN